MNQRQKEIQQVYLNNEKACLNELKKTYQNALDDIEGKIADLLGRSDADLQHVIYQVEYQKAMKKQVESILDSLQTNNFDTISQYLSHCYEEGFLGTMYDLQGQGIPLMIPIDQEQVVQAVTQDTKLSEGLYSALGKDVSKLKKDISSEISRGISQGLMFSDIAKNISRYAGISQNNAMRIARTEGGRIQSQASFDASVKAKDKGADVVKQWDSTLDGKTRDSHRKLDGQIRELDEPFEVNGKSAMFPHDFGDPAEDCNCRCAYLQRARWAVDQPFTKWSEDAPILIDDDGTTQYVQFDSAKDYKEFKKQYWQASGQVANSAQKINSENLSDSGLIKKFKQKKNTNDIKKNFEKGLKNVENEDAKTIFENLLERNEIKPSLKTQSRYKDGIVRLGTNADESSLAHELFHDLYHEIAKTDSEFMKQELFNDYASLFVKAKMENMDVAEYLAKNYSHIFDDIDEYFVKEEYRGFSDVLHGLSDGMIDLGYAHRQDGYWLVENKLPNEATAQFGRMYYDSDEKVLQLYKDILPESTNAMEQKMKGIADVLRKKD